MVEVTKSCETCNVSFTSDHRFKRRFCSVVCVNKWKRGQSFSLKTQFKKGQAAHNKKDKAVGLCLNCQLTFHKYVSSLQFCSVKCSASYLTKGKPKDRSIVAKSCATKLKQDPLYGSRTKLHRRLRSSKQWRDWRLSVFTRDNYKCTCCNRGGYIEPHHVITVKSCIKEGNINMIFDINNGKTLCRTCHMTAHNWNIKGDSQC